MRVFWANWGVLSFFMAAVPAFFPVPAHAMSGGRLSAVLTTSADDRETLTTLIQQDDKLAGWRKKIALNALSEAKRGLCGKAARDRYGAGSGKAWCSEFARWVFRDSGSDNIRYCDTEFLGACVDYIYLKEADTVDDLAKLFKANGSRFKYNSKDQVVSGTPHVGDYLAISNDAELGKDHSAVIVAVAEDNAYLYTVEGNVGDCVKFMRRKFISGGQVESHIYGIGQQSSDWY